MSLMKFVLSFTFSILFCTTWSTIASDIEISEFPTRFLNIAKETEFFDYMVSIRRKIHENPEIGFEEIETSKLIRSELNKMGVYYKYPIAVTGVVGYIGTGQPPFIALRSDMDALPMQEFVEWEHKSKVPGKMHACGHDGHVAMLLGAAQILQDHKEDIKGTILLIFQPAEELGNGAKKVIESGILDNVKAIFGLHLLASFNLGQVGTRSGPILAGTGFFEAVISGKGGHAALPQYSIDPVLAASSVVVSLQHIVSREADPLDSQVVTVAKFQGGGALNTIHDSVIIGGTFRAFSRKSMKYIMKRIEEIIKGQSSVHRCNATVDFFVDDKPIIPATINDEILHKHFVNVAEKIIGTRNIKDMKPIMGSEDFAFYQELLPAYYFIIGMQNETREKLQVPHSPYFEIDEEALPYGAAFHASLALTYLADQFQPKEHVLKGSSIHDEL